MDGWVAEIWTAMTDEQRKDLPQMREKRPRVFDPDRRAVLQAELNAIFAYLYGLSKEDLRYILDPEDVCGVGKPKFWSIFIISAVFFTLDSSEFIKYNIFAELIILNYTS